MSNKKEELMGLPGAIFTGIGSAVGVALVAYIGFVIAGAGKAAIISIFIGLTIGICSGLPTYFLTKRTSIKGAHSGLIELGLGKASGAFYAYTAIVSIGFLASYPTSIASYIVSAFPSLAAYQQMIGFAILVLAVLTLCFGVKLFENASKLFGVLLLIGLTVFTILGLVKIVQLGVNPFDFSGDPIYSVNGINGILTGVPLFAGTCGGFTNIAYMGDICKEPRKNIPKAILVSGLVMCFFWIFLTIVAANVLPVEQVAGQPLTYVAKELMPEWMAIAFVLTGPVMAILTTFIPGLQMNASAIGVTAAKGFLPKFLAPKEGHVGLNRKLIIILGAVIGVILMFNLPVNVVVSNIMPCIAFGGSMLCGGSHVAIAFRKSELFDNKKELTVYRVVSIIGLIASTILFILSIRAISVTSAIINIIVIIVFYSICNYKIRKDEKQAAEATK